MGDCVDRHGNCTEPSDDGQPAQCVGRWATDKHAYIAKYIDAAAGPRKDYLGPGKAGTTYIDLFAGPGRARIADTGQFVEGSPLIALKQEMAPFSRVVLCDLAPENAAALAQRTKGYADRTVIIRGDCNEKIDEVIKYVPEYGLNFALIDPYGLEPLNFETIGKLAAYKRMDLIFNFPIHDMKRNFKTDHVEEGLDRFLGTKDWRPKVLTAGDMVDLIPFFRDRLSPFGYTGNDVRPIRIKNNKNVLLYYLVFASKHPTANRIWKSVTKNTPGGQIGFDWS